MRVATYIFVIWDYNDRELRPRRHEEWSDTLNLCALLKLRAIKYFIVAFFPCPLCKIAKYTLVGNITQAYWSDITEGIAPSPDFPLCFFFFFRSFLARFFSATFHHFRLDWSELCRRCSSSLTLGARESRFFVLRLICGWNFISSWSDSCVCIGCAANKKRKFYSNARLNLSQRVSRKMENRAWEI